MSVEDARCCERILRAHSRTFYLASLFLPPEKRRGALALYSFCRLADDLVDDATMRGSSPEEVRARLALHLRGLNRAFHGRPDSPVFREVAWTVQRFGVPRAPLDELLDGVALDLDGCRYRNWRELERYCEGGCLVGGGDVHPRLGGAGRRLTSLGGGLRADPRHGHAADEYPP